MKEAQLQREKADLVKTIEMLVKQLNVLKNAFENTFLKAPEKGKTENVVNYYQV